MPLYRWEGEYTAQQRCQTNATGRRSPTTSKATNVVRSSPPQAALLTTITTLKGTLRCSSEIKPNNSKQGTAETKTCMHLQLKSLLPGTIKMGSSRAPRRSKSSNNPAQECHRTPGKLAYSSNANRNLEPMQNRAADSGLNIENQLKEIQPSCKAV